LTIVTHRRFTERLENGVMAKHAVDYECEKTVSVLLDNSETILDFVELKNRTVC